MTRGVIKFFSVPGHKCGSGETDAWYGVITPIDGAVPEPKKMFLEVMGGAVCYSAASCSDNSLRRWMDIRRYFMEYMSGTSSNLFDALTGGLEVPLGLFQALEAGYLPNNADHPHAGRYGVYVPACTADAFLGTCIMNYTSQTASQGQRVHHTGGTVYGLILDAIKAFMPDLEEINLVGGSGSAVASIAWSKAVADAFPDTQVKVLADSPFHLMPGRAVYQYFWDNVPWSPNPNLASLPNRENHLEGEVTPHLSFDWRDLEAIPKMLQNYGTRIQLAYIACDNDYVVYGDRALLQSHSTFDGVVDQIPEMWWFLLNLHENAPVGSAFSYIQNGNCHHQTRQGWQPPANDGSIGPKTFVENFLRGLPPDADEVCKRHFWCCGMDGNFSSGACGSGTESSGASGLSALSGVAFGLLTLFTALLY